MNKEKIPLVSILVVTYNQKNYLKECIDSILSQDYENIEIIIADDYSKDGTQDMLKEYNEKYPNKFILKLSERNQGITKNSNLAHFACNGKYIAWMGGDDLMLPSKIRKQVEYMENNPTCTICYHNLDVFESETNKTLYLYNEKVKINGTLKEYIKYGVINGACSSMIRKDKTPKDGFNIFLPVASDYFFSVETLANGGTINYIDEVLGRYRRHKNNVTGRTEKITQNDLDHLNICNLIIFQYPQYFNEAIHRYAMNLIGIRHKVNYFEALFKSFCLSPSMKSIGGLFIYLFTFGKVKL